MVFQTPQASLGKNSIKFLFVVLMDRQTRQTDRYKDFFLFLYKRQLEQVETSDRDRSGRVSRVKQRSGREPHKTEFYVLLVNKLLYDNLKST